ncbi:hypothetical protein GE107_24730 [Cohnella sp. CFH 77786]|uniref:hypothetical protein n=1 Tax=Cohnella sp. CFH 77786 TaxID=2662265 RepID=UPI001C60D477|nr:hypothetical protein [Cohnella sp. CFH 77786]MBW5449235.1 hypothetical protein [Cohnella sp. CFH 77786]
MSSMLLAGTFDSESYWRDEKCSKLPAIPDKERSRIVMAMDELMAPLCSRNDTLLTRFPMEEAHKNYLASIGFPFAHICSGTSGEHPNLFRVLGEGKDTDDRLKKFGRMSPYSVVPYVHEVMTKYGYANKLPSLESVKRVNSKMYSARLSERLLGTSYSKPVYSAQQLQESAHSLFELHGSVLVKDPFGVSGKGNILLQTGGSLERFVSYIRKQEAEGANTSLLVEPFFAVERDFSCQFEIAVDGAYRLVGLQQMLNKQFAYAGSETMEGADIQALESAGYFAVMEQVASSLYLDGYFGHVCVDSMVLWGGTLVPIVEINARKSMGLINHKLDQTLACDGKKGFFTFRSVGCRHRFDYGMWLQELKHRGILYPNHQGEGILLLSSATLFAGFDEARIPEAANGKPVKGRLYMSVVAGDSTGRKRLLDRLQESFVQLGGMWYG